MLTINTRNLGYGFVSRYHRKNRTSYMHWLGTVTDNGRTGALSHNSRDDIYFLNESNDMSYQLDREEVRSVLAKLSEPAAPGAPVRKLKLCRQVMVTMPDDQLEAARVMGGGNLSAGLRLCVATVTGIQPTIEK